MSHRQGDPSEAGTKVVDQLELEPVLAGAVEALLEMPLDQQHVLRRKLAIEIIVEPLKEYDRLAGKTWRRGEWFQGLGQLSDRQLDC